MVKSAVCISRMYVVGWCEGNDAICLILTVGYATLLFLKAVKKQERSVIHVKILPFLLRVLLFVTIQCIWCARFFALENVLIMNV